MTVSSIKLTKARNRVYKKVFQPYAVLFVRKIDMSRFLIYLFPALADVIIAATMFVCSNRLADAGKSRTEVAMVFAAWAGVYIASNQMLARFVTSRNAASMMIAANLLFTVTAFVFTLIVNAWAIYFTLGILAVASALFFLPFQIFMKAAEPDQHRGVVRSVALYTFSWSLGFASGPFIAGFIYQWLGWQWCFAFTGLLGLLTALGVKLLKHHARYHHSETNPSSHSPIAQLSRTEVMNYHNMPDFAWLGWVIGGIGCLGIYSFLSLLPSVGVSFSISKSHIGSITALLYIAQSLVGLSLMHSRVWMYRPVPVVGFAAFGLVGLAGFGFSLLQAIDGVNVLTVPLRTLGLYASVACYGVFSGSFFFGLVFHSLVHPQRSARYVAINETVVGISGVAGPVLAGTLADRFGFVTFPAVLIAIILGGAILQSAVLKRLKFKCK